MVVATPVFEDEATSLPCAGLAAEGVRPADFHLGVLFERGLDAVVVADLDSGCIVLWNPAAERLFGYSAVEAIGQPIEILMDEGIGAVHHAGLHRYRQSGHGLIIDAGKPVEVPAMTRSGQDIRVELTLGPLESACPGRFVLGIMRDVTDRKRVELMQFELARVHNARSEAEAAIAARDEFLAGVAAEHGYEKLERFARALVDLKLIDAGQLALHVEETDLALVVRQSVAAARERTRDHRLVTRGASCVMTRCDPVRLAEVVDNLIDNAITHNPDGCLIDVCVRRPTRSQVEISVRDHGVGVAPGRRERLFERYYRATPGGAGAGAGLGLHLSRRLVELHGGSLEAAFPSTGGMALVTTLPMPG